MQLNKSGDKRGMHDNHVSGNQVGTYKHGLIHHPLYRKWSDMRNRCNNPNNNSYDRYGAKGVRVCKQWDNDFESFYQWSIENGWKPGLVISRKGDTGNYEPNNCEYKTAHENNMERVQRDFVSIRCIDLDIIFENHSEAAKFILDNGYATTTNLKTIRENIRCKGVRKGGTSYGFRWEVVHSNDFNRQA